MERRMPRLPKGGSGADEDSEKRVGYLEWIGATLDPEAFDADEVNRKLRWLK
jgi:hypothetical protein